MSLAQSQQLQALKPKLPPPPGTSQWGASESDSASLPACKAGIGLCRLIAHCKALEAARVSHSTRPIVHTPTPTWEQGHDPVLVCYMAWDAPQQQEPLLLGYMCTLAKLYCARACLGLRQA